VLDLDALQAAPDRRTLDAYGDGKVNVLFVGRCAPNKKLEDVLMAFAVFQKAVCRNSRLIHAGSFAGTERYHHVLVAMARELQVSDVVFAGAVSQAELLACYRSAHAFLCLSEHEGFCIPLLEAMLHGVPVLAYAAAAVPETMDGAGILFDRKEWGAVAEMLGRVTAPGPLRDAVLAGQAARVERFRRRDPEAELRALLTPLL
jgi:glycosyltransferase involved in cell wall biosynthesis